MMPPPPEGQEGGRLKTVALIIAALVLAAAFVYVVPILPGAIERIATFRGNGGGTNSTEGLQSYSPEILNGSADLSFPPGYGTLANYTLGLINQDRSDFGLGPVTLSPIQSGEQHADSMLRYDYFSHFDTQGLKPYMRYTLLGGTGAVFENVAYVSYQSQHYSTIGPVEGDLKFLEYSMIYNDSVCCNNGHRDNILNPMHDRVSIGIAYNSTTLFFVEDFENNYADLSISLSKTLTVTMIGNLLDPHISSSEAIVTFDNTPVAETPSQLDSFPHEYNAGTILGGVLPKSACALYPFGCSTLQTGTTVYADTWQVGPSSIDISFSLSAFVSQEGAGVYTVYVITGPDTNSAITSYSFFVQ
jgi:hypothetical protein